MDELEDARLISEKEKVLAAGSRGLVKHAFCTSSAVLTCNFLPLASFSKLLCPGNPLLLSKVVYFSFDS